MGLNTGEKQSSSSTPDGAVNLAEYLTTGLNTAGSPAVTFIGHNNTPVAATTNFMAGLSPAYTHNLGRDYWLESRGTQTYTITFDFGAAGYTCLPSSNPADYSYIARFSTSDPYFTVGSMIGLPVINGLKVSFTHTTSSGLAFVNVGFRTSAAAVSPTVYSFNGNCAGGGCNWENTAN